MKLTISPIRFLFLAIILLSCGQSKKNKDSASESTKQSTNKLDPNSFEIFKTNHKPVVENFYVLLKTKNLDEASLKDFVKKFRLENCTKDCNINLYDTKSIEKYIDIYPMPKPVYIEYADHFIALSSFDSPATVWLYPYQDMKYKEFGGKNWKKEPIK